MVNAKPSRAKLLALLASARDAIEESADHWPALPLLHHDPKIRRQHDEVLAVLDAIRDRVETWDDPIKR